ncbi:diaminopimelate epimerase [Draconibacterium sp. IB214405]|uniref:diaminopimelate epimerase n=1 Tax=Draconibacterium sp. IB214405 TaxID=3097352 RepID=UPI002A104C36|nr:diaminopimelate epimerase [Draconibacterium sp. IB214405]MDX8341524.1 diaminopimelate epimerase [Draconibacterium sp. IB214405]
MQNFFVKSHGLGNDYIVLNQEDISFELTEKAIIRICDVHFGIGSDGILLKVPSDKADFGLRILNPDGSEAEKSGNGLRIFSKYLYDHGFTTEKSFSIETPGGLVRAEIMEEKSNKAYMIKVDMGQAIFEAEKIPVNLEQEECIDESLPLHDKTFQINCVSVGNPHCVILVDELYEEEIKNYGSDIENHPMFPNRINVQFAKVISRNEVEIMIWERGAGWTLASGSSSCAVACTVVKRGLTDRNLTIKMPGGELAIEIDEDWQIRMTGEVREIGTGTLGAELIEDLEL